MLLKTKDLLKMSVKARDGDIGSVKDVYLDDLYWTVRYLVVETGSLLKSHKVLLSPESINRAEWPEQTGRDVIAVDLNHEQVCGSPSIDADMPVSRQKEEEVRRYFGWPAYWGTPMYAGLYPAGGMPLTVPAAAVVNASGGYTQSEGQARPSDATPAPGQPVPTGDPHLRSAREITGYTVVANDGDIGHVEDMIVDDGSWGVAYLVVDTKNWWPGKKVVVAPGWVKGVSWSQKSIEFDATREAIKRAPEYDAAQPLSGDYIARLHDYYGRPRYADIAE